MESLSEIKTVELKKVEISILIKLLEKRKDQILDSSETPEMKLRLSGSYSRMLTKLELAL